MTYHVRLSPSGADRWMTCTKSPEMEDNYEDKSSTFADEGTLAHSLAEHCLREKEDAFDFLNQIWKDKTSDGREVTIKVTSDFADNVQMYVEYVRDVEAEAETVHGVWYEERVHYDAYVPDGSGTADAILAYNEDGKKVLHVIDLKFGRGVAVDAENNRQGMLYALGAYSDHDWLLEMSDDDLIRITIHQPRIGDGLPSTWTISVAELLAFAEEAKAAAQDIECGNTKFVVSEKGCRFCKHRNDCEARAAELMELLLLELDDETLEGELPEVSEMNDTQVAAIVSRSKEIKNFLNGLEDMALSRAAKGETTYDGLKLVEGISRRAWEDENTAIDILEEVLGAEDTWASKLISPTEAERKIKARKLDANDAKKIRSAIIKPQGKLTLVSEDDKRPAVDLAEYNGLEDETL